MADRRDDEKAGQRGRQQVQSLIQGRLTEVNESGVSLTRVKW
ncbi:MAG TPA: hypothetical protein VNQ79_28250 [Blastocatellia bacterium]|nr:hypothetical protein [Blastocatellia bacterium]